MLSHAVQFQRKMTPGLRTEQPHFTEEINGGLESEMSSCVLKLLRNRYQNPKFPVWRGKNVVLHRGFL